MVQIIVEISKYVFLFLMLLFTVHTFGCLTAKDKKKRQRKIHHQLAIIIIFNILAYFVLFLQTGNGAVAVMFISVLIFIIVTQALFRAFYKRASFALLNATLMLISLGLVILTRLEIDLAKKQLIIAVGAMMLSLLIPVIIRKVKVFSKWSLVFAIIGILLLGAVFVLARVSGGSKLSLNIGGITFQFSEFVKITFVFCVAGLLAKSQTFKQVLVVTFVAGLHVGILVASKDLGAALIYFVAYIVMVCVATRKLRYAAIGLGGMAAASVVAYKLFDHVKVRVDVWQDPFADYQGTGYQIVQALFGVCAGGWFGTGLMNGSPDMIPVVQEDFTFAAVCEEFGILFSICLILICAGVYLIIINIALRLNNQFYKLIALGLGTEYAFQVFLTIGGTTNFIPMTGVTLPLISYGGSSISCTIFMIMIIEGLYLMRKDELKEEHAVDDGPPDFEDNVYNDEKTYNEKRYKGGNNRSSHNRDIDTKNPNRTKVINNRGTKVEREGKPTTESQKEIDLEKRIEEQTEQSLNW